MVQHTDKMMASGRDGKSCLFRGTHASVLVDLPRRGGGFHSDSWCRLGAPHDWLSWRHLVVLALGDVAPVCPLPTVWPAQTWKNCCCCFLSQNVASAEDISAVLAEMRVVPAIAEPVGLGEEMLSEGSARLIRTVGKDNLLQQERYDVGVEFVASSLAECVADFLLAANKICSQVSWYVRTCCAGDRRRFLESPVPEIPRRRSQSVLHKRFPRRRGWLGWRSSCRLCAKIISCSRNRGKNGATSSVGSSLFGITAQGESITCSLMPIHTQCASKRHSASAVQLPFRFPAIGSTS